MTLVLRGRVNSTFVTALPSTLTTLSNSVPRRTPGPWFTVVGLAVVFCVAFAARLIPLLRGGGLHAMGNYDDGVHYAAAMGLAHGLLPYRDFVPEYPPLALPAFGYSAWLSPLLVLLPWYAAELGLAWGVGWYLSWRMPLALLIRDIVFPGVWAYAFIAGEVSWRGNSMKIRTDGEDELNAASPTMSHANLRSDGRS